MKYLSTGLFLFGLCLSGCSSKPDEQLSLAQKAMEQAKEQHAAEFASADWKSAEEVFQQAQSMLASERNSEAATLLLRAKSRFEKARDIAKAKRETLLKEVQGLQKAIDLRYAALKTNIANSGPRLSARRKESLEDSCKDIDKAVEKLKAELDQGEYNAARTTAQTTFRQVYDTEKALEGYLGAEKQPAS